MEKRIALLDFFSIKRLFVASVLAMMLLSALVISYPVDLKGVESNVIHSIQLSMLDFKLLYQSPEEYPFNINQYSPLYFFMTAGLLQLLQVDPEDFIRIRVLARSITTLILGLSLMVFFNIIKGQLKQSAATAYTASGLFLLLTFPWYTISRPDVLVMLFFLLAFQLMLSILNGASEKKLGFLLGLIFILGLGSKLSMAYLMLAFGAYWVFTGKWRIIGYCSLGFAVSLTLTYFIFLGLPFELTALKENIIDGINNGVDLSMALVVYREYIGLYGFFTITLLLLSMAAIRLPKPTEDAQMGYFLWMFSGVFVLSLIATLKYGSAINYFNEALVIGLILLIYLVSSKFPTYTQLTNTLLMAFGIALAINHGAWFGPTLLSSLKHGIGKIPDESAQLIEIIQEDLGDAYIFSQNREVGMAFPANAILFPNDVHYKSHQRKLIDYTTVHQYMEEGKIKYLVLFSDVNPIYDLDFLPWYEFKGLFGIYYLFEYKGNPSP
jgi:hypothetical protein